MTSELFKNNDFSPNTHTIILITKDETNSALCDLVKQIYSEENIHIILYNIKRLLFNIIEHQFVPKHIVLSNEEKSEIYNKYFIGNDSQIPSISRFDPVAIAIFIKPGELCKIIRSSPNAVSSDYYRLCVNN